MGKRLGVQRRGAGRHRYTRPSHRYKTNAKYRNASGTAVGTVNGFDSDPSKTAVIASIKWDDSQSCDYIAAEGLSLGGRVEQGDGARLQVGNVLKLANIPEGTPIFNIELSPGDGGKAVRASGSTALLVSKKDGKVVIKLPSRRMKPLDEKCRATIGIVAGGGRTEKPFVKAGNKFHREKAKGRRYPIVRGVAMNAVAHPHGGSQHHTGKSTCVKRTAPPGQKVGHIAASRTGRRKR